MKRPRQDADQAPPARPSPIQGASLLARLLQARAKEQAADAEDQAKEREADAEALREWFQVMVDEDLPVGVTMTPLPHVVINDRLRVVRAPEDPGSCDAEIIAQAWCAKCRRWFDLQPLVDPTDLLDLAAADAHLCKDCAAPAMLPTPAEWALLLAMRQILAAREEAERAR